MSSAKIHVVVHDNSGGWHGRPMPGVDLSVPPFFAYVLGNPNIRASGSTEKEVLERIKDVVLVKKEAGRPVTRKIVEMDVGDHMLTVDVMEE